MSWTPGPWKVTRAPFGEGFGVTGPNSQGVADIVGYVGQPDEADARLIAAAPEMVLFVEAAAEDHNDATGWCNLHDTDTDSGYHSRLEGGCFVDRARALLARIRGAEVTT